MILVSLCAFKEAVTSSSLYRLQWGKIFTSHPSLGLWASQLVASTARVCGICSWVQVAVICTVLGSTSPSLIISQFHKQPQSQVPNLTISHSSTTWVSFWVSDVCHNFFGLFRCQRPQRDTRIPRSRWDTRTERSPRRSGSWRIPRTPR